MFYGTLKKSTIGIFFTTNKMPISLKALDFPFHFHLITVSLGNTGRYLLRFSECQPVWVKPLFVPVWSRANWNFLHIFFFYLFLKCIPKLTIRFVICLKLDGVALLVTGSRVTLPPAILPTSWQYGWRRCVVGYIYLNCQV